MAFVKYWKVMLAACALTLAVAAPGCDSSQTGPTPVTPTYPTSPEERAKAEQLFKKGAEEQQKAMDKSGGYQIPTDGSGPSMPKLQPPKGATGSPPPGAPGTK